jgi:predicted MPP superfamily phosphohydrolase
MNFTSVRTVFFLFLFFYLILQYYLLTRVTAFLKRRVAAGPARRALQAGVWIFFLVMLSPFAWIMLFGLIPQEPYPQPVQTGFLLFAIWLFGSVGWAAILWGYRLLGWVASRMRQPGATPDLERRRLLKLGASVFAGAPFIAGGYGSLVERRRFRVDHFSLPVEGLSSALSQLTIVQLTDIHVGPFMPPEELAAYVETINRLAPDLIALTGDFVAGSASEVDPCVEVLSALRARYGTFACLGNHDVYAGIEDELERRFGEKGIQVLRNGAVSLPVGNSRLNLLGIDDLKWGKPDLPQAIKAAAGKEPGEVRILLSHRPEVFPDAAERGIDLTLSGHYHGGQIKLADMPWNISLARLVTPYAEGLFRLPRGDNPAISTAKGSTLFVGRGIGITGLPIRINCPPQIAHLTLRKA